MAIKPTPQNTNSKIIKVLLVDDSSLALTILQRMLSTSREIQVVGTAGNGREALELIPTLDPDIICTDYHMPVMDGIRFTEEVMERFPRPILVISVSVQKNDTPKIFRLLEAGALDVFPKPVGGLETVNLEASRELCSKIRILSGVHIIKKRKNKKTAASFPERPISFIKEKTPVRIITIGASTGGPQVLVEILSQLPGDFPVPIVCVQHIVEEFTQGLVDWLDSQCRIKVKIVRPGEVPLPGTLYFPESGTHLLVDGNGKLRSSDGQPLDGHRPSITVTMRSLAEYYGASALGILLTGMGFDGAEGMQAISQAGGTTIAQNEQSCAIFGMPKKAIDLGAARYILGPEEIVDYLMKQIYINHK